jgi:hypothetical protein
LIVLILLAFAGMLAGIFLLLGMTPFEFAEDLTKSFASREVPISKRIGQLNHPKEAKGIQKTVREAKEMMILTGRGGKFAALCALSLFLAAMGAVICIVKLFHASGTGGRHGADPVLVCPVHLPQLQKADEQ